MINRTIENKKKYSLTEKKVRQLKSLDKYTNQQYLSHAKTIRQILQD